MTLWQNLGVLLFSVILKYFIYLKLVGMTKSVEYYYPCYTFSTVWLFNVSTHNRGFTSPWKSLNFFSRFSRPGKYLKTDMILESPWICVWRSLKVLEFDFGKWTRTLHNACFSHRFVFCEALTWFGFGFVQVVCTFTYPVEHRFWNLGQCTVGNFRELYTSYASNFCILLCKQHDWLLHMLAYLFIVM